MSPLFLSARCDLFVRYETRTSALEYEDFNSAKSYLIEWGEKFGEISLKFASLYPLDQKDLDFEVPIHAGVVVEISARDCTPSQYLTLILADLGVLTLLSEMNLFSFTLGSLRKRIHFFLC